MLRVRKIHGWTLLELLTALTVAGVLTSIAYSAYSGIVERTKINQAIVDIAKIHSAVEKYRLSHVNKPPLSLAEIGMDLTDPWGAPYQFLNFATLPGNSKGPVRKDRNLVPLNSKYDLYSKGPDGKSVSPLTAKASRDDVIMANDGGYIGLAADY